MQSCSRFSELVSQTVEWSSAYSGMQVLGICGPCEGSPGVSVSSAPHSSGGGWGKLVCTCLQAAVIDINYVPWVKKVALGCAWWAVACRAWVLGLVVSSPQI